MTNGEEFTISNGFHGHSGPMNDRQTAEIQMSFLITKYATIQVDQGKTINVSHILYEWVDE